jgi:signal transduction histidine kinase
MTGRLLSLRSAFNGLSARLLVLTVFFVMLGEVLIFVPSVARFRLNYLENRIDAAHLAIFALEATPDNMVSQDLADRLLAHVGAHGIIVHKPNNSTLMLDAERPPPIDATYDLREDGFFHLIRDAMMTLEDRGQRILRVLAPPPKDSRLVVEVLLDEAPMRKEMWAFGIRVLELSVVISLITAALVYLSLQWLLVAPLRRLTQSMMVFRDDPEDAARVIVPSDRSDEIGLAQRELATMQETVRQALRQKERLAALGTAVSKINHDLRNILSTARLMSDTLADSEVPEVRRVTPALLAAIDRAVSLCTGTLNFTREDARPLVRRRFALAGLVEELAEIIERPGEDGTRLVNEVSPTLMARADRDQFFRVLQNLAWNAVQAGSRHVLVRAQTDEEGLVLEVADDGPGLPPKARDNLFRPFAGSARPGGTGLGLAIAREVMRAHGGDIVLVESTASGTVFRLRLPDQPGAAPAERADTAANPARAPAP